jgi:hypothetical protein
MKNRAATGGADAAASYKRLGRYGRDLRLLPGLPSAQVLGSEIVDRRDATAKRPVDDARRKIEAELLIA